MGVKRAFSLREKYEIYLEREKQVKAGKKVQLGEFGLLFPDQSGKGIPKSKLSGILAMSDEILKNPLVMKHIRGIIIEENLQKLTSPPADSTTDLPSTNTTTTALSTPPIPTLAEALSQLDDLNRFFQSMPVSALAFPHTPTQLSIQDLVDTIGQAQGLKYYQQKHKVQASLKDFWVPTSSTSNTLPGSAN